MIPTAPEGCIHWLLFNVETGALELQGSAMDMDTVLLQQRPGSQLMLGQADWFTDYVDPVTKRIETRPALGWPTEHTVAVGEELVFSGVPVGTQLDDMLIDDGELVLAWDSPGRREVWLRPPFPLLPVQLKVTVE